MDNNNIYNQQPQPQASQPQYTGAPAYNNAAPQPGYGSYNQGYNPNDQLAPVMSVGEWMITLIIMAIPLVGIIMYFVWAFGDGTNPSKKNFCKAGLIFMLISVVLSILFAATCGAAMSGMMRML